MSTNEPPPLPQPGMQTPFKGLVDAYTNHHGVSKMETFRRISDATGSPVNTIKRRYHGRGDKPWVLAAPMTAESYAALMPELEATFEKYAARRERERDPAPALRPSHEDVAQTATIIARFVRDAIEDFHCDYLTDKQMAELNPLVRRGIAEALVIIERLSSPDPELRAGARVVLAMTSPPPYWEPPEVPDLDDTLRTHAQAVASGTLPQLRHLLDETD